MAQNIRFSVKDENGTKTITMNTNDSLTICDCTRITNDVNKTINLLEDIGLRIEGDENNKIGKCVFHINTTSNNRIHDILNDNGYNADYEHVDNIIAAVINNVGEDNINDNEQVINAYNNILDKM